MRNFDIKAVSLDFIWFLELHLSCLLDLKGQNAYMETYFRVNKITEHDIPYGDFKEYLYHEKNDIPENYAGCLGYPTRATNKKGEMIWNRMIEKMVNDYKILFK
mgnify:FL=1